MSNTIKLTNTPLQGVKAENGKNIPIGGYTFTPAVSAEGVISWTNDGNLENPTPVNIKGVKGDKGEQGVSGVYVGTGAMPDGYNVQIDPSGTTTEVEDLGDGLDEFKEQFDYTYQILKKSNFIAGSLYNSNGTVWEGMVAWSRYPKIKLKRGSYKITKNNGSWNANFTGLIDSNGNVTLLTKLPSYVNGTSYASFTIEKDMTFFLSVLNTQNKNIMLVKGSVFPSDYCEGFNNVISKKVNEELNKQINAEKVDVSNILIAHKGVVRYTHDASSGNTWISLNIEQTKKTKNFLRLDTEIESMVGSIRVFIQGSNAINGSTLYVVVADLTKVGKTVMDIDLNHAAVYRHLDLSKPMQLLLANLGGPVDVTYSYIDIYDIITTLENKTLIETLNDFDSKISSNEEEIKQIKGNKTSEITSPNGTKYIMQVSDSGEFVAIPKIPSNILYIGNSLLLGWGTFGMASSNSREDYYYKVNSYLESKGKTIIADRLSGTGYEGTTTENAQNEWLTNTLLPHLNNNLELVIIQLGDNVNTNERVSAFENGTKKLIRFIREHAPKTRVAWVGEWYSTKTKQTYISDACIECGATFVNISDLSGVSGNQAKIGDVVTKDDGTTVTIDDGGVASHPSNQGMTDIANRIIENLFE